MDPWTEASEAAFSAYVDSLIDVVGHADRAEPLKDYCLGLLMPGERKSVEPLAAVTSPARVSAQHQSLLHFVGQAAVIGRLRSSKPQFSPTNKTLGSGVCPYRVN